MLSTSSRVSNSATARGLSIPLTLVYSCALLACTGLAQAQTAEPSDSGVELTPIVVTAAGIEQKVTDAPASVSVITRQDLAKRPYVTLLDAVRDIEGVDVGETRDKAGQGTISLRGMGSDYTLILVDGKRQNNHGDIYPNGFGGSQFGHMPPLDSIERIEVIRGPASTLYGADAMGGVINIITRKVPKKWGGSITHGRDLQLHGDYGDSRTTDFNVAGPVLDGKFGLALRGSFYNRKASSPTFNTTYDPSGAPHRPELGFGDGGKTVDNENQSLGARLSWALTDKQTVYFDIDRSKQEYDNSISYDENGKVITTLGTVDNVGGIWILGGYCSDSKITAKNKCLAPNNWTTRANPRAGYTPTQEFTRDTWSLTHEGRWSFGNSFVSLSHIATNNNGRTLPFTVGERQHLLAMLESNAYTAPDGTVYDYANMTEAERKDAAKQTFLPRPKRTLESRQYTLDAKLDLPMGNHNVVVGGQVIRGELEDGIFGMEDGRVGGAQEHNMFSVFAEDNWNIIEPLVLTTGIRYDDHNVFGSHVSPRVYGVYTLTPEWTVKGGVATGYKTPKTTDLYDGINGFSGQGATPLYGNPNLKPETSMSKELAVYWQSPRGHNFNATVFHNTFDDKLSSQPCGGPGEQPCADAGDYSELGYTSGANRKTNIDKVVLQGLELSGRWQATSSIALRANYTWLDSEQRSGTNKGRPLGNSPEHMLNASVDWKATEKLSLSLSSQNHLDRYRSYDATNKREIYYQDYKVMNLGASYRLDETFTFNVRINNLLDKNFATYKTTFEDNGNGTYTPTFVEDYDNKDARRSLWVSVNAKF